MENMPFYELEECSILVSWIFSVIFNYFFFKLQHTKTHTSKSTIFLAEKSLFSQIKLFNNKCTKIYIWKSVGNKFILINVWMNLFGYIIKICLGVVKVFMYEVSSCAEGKKAGKLGLPSSLP